MRLWSIHPEYLDSRGLVALWREGLLARKVLEGKTIGYRRHPQLARFKQLPDPVAAMDVYLSAVLAEAQRRGYRFDGRKIRRRSSARGPIAVTSGQLEWELRHLTAKLRRRAPAWLSGMGSPTATRPHPLFEVVPGSVEEWERAATSEMSG